MPEYYEAEIRHLYYVTHDQAEKALKLSQMLVDLHPEDLDYHNSLVRQLFTEDRHEEVLEAIKTYRTISGDLFENIHMEISSLYRLGEIDRAIESLEAYKKAHAEETWAASSLGLLYTEKGEWEKAENMLEEAVLFDPESKIYPRLLEHMTFMRDSGELVTEAYLQEHAGTYWILNFAGFEFQIRPQRKVLLGQATNQGKFELYPIGKDRFVTAFDFTMKSGRDSTGRIDHMLCTQLNNEYVVTKMTPRDAGRD